MNHQLPAVTRPRAFKPVKRLAMLGMAAVLSVPIMAQEDAKPPAEAPPAIKFQVLKTRKINLGDHSIYLNAVVPPVLPPALPSPRTPSAAKVAEAEAAEAREPHKKPEVLFLSATVYDRRVTEIRWQGETGEHRFFSNIDFNLLIGAGSIETSDTLYTLMLALRNEPSGESDALAQKAAAGAWAARLGKAIPVPETFSKTRSEYLVAEAEKLTPPSEEELAVLDALHVWFDANRQRLAEEHVKREAANAEQARWLKEHPPVPPDIVVNVWSQSHPVPKAREAR